MNKYYIVIPDHMNNDYIRVAIEQLTDVKLYNKLYNKLFKQVKKVNIRNKQIEVINKLRKNKITKELCEDINECFFGNATYGRFKRFENSHKYYFYYDERYDDELVLFSSTYYEYISLSNFVFKDFESARRLCKTILYLYYGTYNDVIKDFLFK